ncbi:hypothetical protein JG688_00010520, partial [Phytophthora aleatoria]
MGLLDCLGWSRQLVHRCGWRQRGQKKLPIGPRFLCVGDNVDANALSARSISFECPKQLQLQAAVRQKNLPRESLLFTTTASG